MSGPDPFRPKPGSNGIGTFVIGVSPIGDIPPFDFWKTIISQYANSDVITTLIGNFDACIDQTANFDAFYDLIMNVASAESHGLDVWGRIVDVSRTLNVGNSVKFFGFDEAGAVSADPFNQSPFFVGQPLTTNFNLDDEPYRTLIFAKAFANICDGSIKSINQLLRTLFPGRGNCFVTDGLDMTMTYTFTFPLSPVELAIVGQSGVLPKPTGVLATVVVTSN